MNTPHIIPFEEYLNEIWNKEPSKILLELFPKLSHPSQSRFHEFFKQLKKLNNPKGNENKKNKPIYKKSKKKYNGIKFIQNSKWNRQKNFINDKKYSKRNR